MRSNLLTLRNTSVLMDRTQDRLATGKKVNTALDNPLSFFTAKSLNTRAGDLNELMDGMGQAIQTIKAADHGINAITRLVQQGRALVNTAMDENDAAQRAILAGQFDTVMTQLDQISTNRDAGYKGVNLLDGDTLTVNFNESRTSQLTIQTTLADFTSGTTGLDIGTAGQATNAWALAANMENDLDSLDAALLTLRAEASAMAQNLSIVNTYQDFTQNMIDTLTEGADKLVLADMNEEAANMLSLQVRQQLGTNSLSLASQAQQSILRLF